MAYIGKGFKDIATANIAVNTMVGDGSDTTLGLSMGSKGVGSVNDVSVFVGGIQQRPGTDFTLSGSTITFTTAPANGIKVVAMSHGDSWNNAPSDNTVTAAKIKDASVTSDKIIGLDAGKLSGSLSAISGVNLTNLNAANITGTLPAIDGSALTGVISYENETSDPTFNSNKTLGTMWVNKTSGEMYILTDDTTNANVWTNVGGGTGNLQANTMPGMPDNNFPAGINTGTTYNHTFIGGTDTGSSNSDIAGAVTHYVVDQISHANALSVAASEVAAGSAHVFTAATITNNVTFRVRSKDNEGGFSADRIITVNVEEPFTGMVATSTNSTNSSGIIDGDYKYHIFNTSGSFNVTTAGENAEVQLLLIAGGGSAGGSDISTGYNNERGGGGGAGGYRHITNITTLANSTNYTITIGGGGSQQALYQHSKGNNSEALTYSATGGGSGGISRYHNPPLDPYVNTYSGYDGRPGGSGGGGMGTYTGAPGGAGNQGGYNPVEGYAGGTVDDSSGQSPSGDPTRAGGGGGSGGPGTYVTTGGGGPGTASTITGSSVTRASGGQVANNTASGAANSGDGGSSGINTSGSGAGGSGVVIIRYKFQ